MIMKSIKGYKTFCRKRLKLNKGFALLYAIAIVSVLVAVALGITQISYNEVKFNTSAQSTNDAFFAADVGAECALYYDGGGTPAGSENVFTYNNPNPTPAPPYHCAGNLITISTVANSNVWYLTVPRLNSAGTGCASVKIDKSITPGSTQITSDGYNNGSGGSSLNWTCNPTANTVDRQLQVTYINH
jgi:hypothetical protein